MTFLVVDDFSTMRRIIRGLLKEIGQDKVEEAEDGNAALYLLRRKPDIGFVITDVNMPNMGGFELLNNIKADEMLKHIPVLFVTAEARKDDIVLAAKSGAAGYIVKPFVKATLEEKIIKIFQRIERK